MWTILRSFALVVVVHFRHRDHNAISVAKIALALVDLLKFSVGNRFFRHQVKPHDVPARIPSDKVCQ